MGAGSCCNKPNSITATTEQCAVPAPTAAPTTAPTAAPTAECAELVYTITAEAYNGAQTYRVSYTGPRGITWDNFDTCVGHISAAGTSAESAANSCSLYHPPLQVRVLRRTDTAGNNEIMGAGSCCNKPNSITATTEQCAVPAPIAAPTTARTAAPSPSQRRLEEAAGSDEAASARAASSIPPSTNVQLGGPAPFAEPTQVEAEAGIESNSTVIGAIVVAAGGSLWALCLWHVLRKRASARCRGGLDDA